MSGKHQVTYFVDPEVLGDRIGEILVLSLKDLRGDSVDCKRLEKDGERLRGQNGGLLSSRKRGTAVLLSTERLYFGKWTLR